MPAKTSAPAPSFDAAQFTHRETVAQPIGVAPAPEPMFRYHPEEWTIEAVPDAETGKIEHCVLPVFGVDYDVPGVNGIESITTAATLGVAGAATKEQARAKLRRRREDRGWRYLNPELRVEHSAHLPTGVSAGPMIRKTPTAAAPGRAPGIRYHECWETYRHGIKGWQSVYDHGARLRWLRDATRAGAFGMELPQHVAEELLAPVQRAELALERERARLGEEAYANRRASIDREREVITGAIAAQRDAEKKLKAAS